MIKAALLTPVDGPELASLCAVAPSAAIIVVRDLEQLRAAFDSGAELLIAYGTGVIVPETLLRRATAGAVNFHAAPPDYPGRDPHHFAVYDGATRYGVTAHHMTAEVDAGVIIGVRYFDIDPAIGPRALLERANVALLELYQTLVPGLLAGEQAAAAAGEAWRGRRTRRRDFEAMCRLSPLITERELGRRLRAFDDPDYDNLWMDVYGYRFQYVRNDVVPQQADPQWADFTESAYRALLSEALNRGYTFEPYGTKARHRHVVWRHDIDLSVHRALALARIEVEAGVRSTWLVNPHSNFYNALEPTVTERLRDIARLGHWLGLHFDASACTLDELRSPQHLRSILRRERRLLEDVLGTRMSAISWHDPERAGLLAIKNARIAGMVNCYSAQMQSKYAYVSDSNGYWRFRTLSEALASGAPRLHILTHPGWWTPLPLPPRSRIERCLLGRARGAANEYDRELDADGRSNIGHRTR